VNPKEDHCVHNLHVREEVIDLVVRECLDCKRLRDSNPVAAPALE